MNRRLSFSAIGLVTLLAFAGVTQSCAFAQNVCPIQFDSVTPAGAGSNSYVILFHNATRFPIKGVEFGAELDSPSPSARGALFISSHLVAPGAEDSVIWNSSIPSSVNPAFKVWAAMVIFHDNSAWKGSDAGTCGYHFTAQTQQSATSNPSSSTPGQSASMTAVEKIALIESGQASLCLVTTNPAGATVDVDGRKIGETPIKFVLLKKASGPRSIDIYKSGYEVIHQDVSPTGNTIRLTETLNPLSIQ